MRKVAENAEQTGRATLPIMGVPPECISDPNRMSLIKVVVAKTTLELVDDVARQQALDGAGIELDLMDGACARNDCRDRVVIEGESKSPLTEASGRAADDRAGLVDSPKRFLEPLRGEKVLTDVFARENRIRSEL